MALTLTPVTTPNQSTLEGSMMGLKFKVFDVTFDSSYLTTGEVVTAASLGWDTIQFVMCEDAVNAAGTLAHGVVARPNSTRTQVAVQAYETAATVDTPHKEATSAADLSTYTARLVFLGT